MPSMIDLIRAAAVPANLVQSAAKGSLSNSRARDDRNSRVPRGK